MLWLLMGHLVCIGQWAAFIMVDHAFLGRGRRFRFPCLWAALLAAVFLVASIRHDIGFFNVESVILNVIYLLVTVLFFGGSWNQKLSACLVNGIMCLLTENTVSYTFAWCKHIPVRGGLVLPQLHVPAGSCGCGGWPACGLYCPALAAGAGTDPAADAGHVLFSWHRCGAEHRADGIRRQRSAQHDEHDADLWLDHSSADPSGDRAGCHDRCCCSRH